MIIHKKISRCDTLCYAQSLKVRTPRVLCALYLNQIDIMLYINSTHPKDNPLVSQSNQNNDKGDILFSSMVSFSYILYIVDIGIKVMNFKTIVKCTKHFVDISYVYRKASPVPSPRDYLISQRALKVDNPCLNIQDNEKCTTTLNTPIILDGNQHGSN